VASYSLLIKPSAARELEELPAKGRHRIIARIQGLARQPRPRNCEKLAGEEKYRLRQGDYRILCSVDDAAKDVTVVKTGVRLK
jgi:mRNA interferase RelE/StbE